jgi:hypothetical protein
MYKLIIFIDQSPIQGYFTHIKHIQLLRTCHQFFTVLISTQGIDTRSLADEQGVRHNLFQTREVASAGLGIEP